MPDPGRDNLDRLGTTLVGLGIIQRRTGIPSWPTLYDDAEHTSLAGNPMHVTSLAHLIAMKHARHSLQDQADLEALQAGRR